MKPLRYVNAAGQPVDPARLPRALPKVKAPVLHRTEDLFAATKHFGFEVVGISEQTLVDAARRARQAKAIELHGQFNCGERHAA